MHGVPMTLEQIRIAVLNSRSDTLMAQRFREAFGIRRHEEMGSRTITMGEYVRHERKRVIYECMAQRYGALDRGTS